MKLFSESIRYELIILTKTERIGVTVDGICRRSALSSRRPFRVLKSTLNKLILQNFDLARVGQQFPIG
jgi:hypothetical protein